MTQQKRAKEQKKMEKAQRKREARALKKQIKGDSPEGDEELELLDGPNYFKDFDITEIKI